MGPHILRNPSPSLIIPDIPILMCIILGSNPSSATYQSCVLGKSSNFCELPFLTCKVKIFRQQQVNR